MPLYDWNQMEPEQLSPMVTRQAIHSDTLTIARIHLQAHAALPSHSHHNEQITTVERGALKMLLGGVEYIIRAGQSITIPPHVPHGVEALEDTLAVDVFTPRRDDWLAGGDAYLRK